MHTFTRRLSTLLHISYFAAHRLQLVALTVVLVVLLLLVALWPWGRGRADRAVVRVVARSCYVLPLDKGDTLYISARPDSLAEASFRAADVTADSCMTTGVWVTEEGHLLTSAALVHAQPLLLPASVVKDRLRRVDSRLLRERESLRQVEDDLDYYARTHDLTDDGYNEVMAYRTATLERARSIDSTHVLLQRALSMAEAEAKLQAEVRATGYSVNDSCCERTEVALRLIHATDDGLLVLRARHGLLPLAFSRLAAYRFGTYSHGAETIGFADLGGPSAAPRPLTLDTTKATLPVTEGAISLNPSCQLCGLRVQGRRLSSYALGSALAHLHAPPFWWLRNVVAWVRRALLRLSDSGETSPFVRTTRLPLSAAAPVPAVGSYSLPSGGHYVGQTVEHDGRRRREGYGEWTDSLGVRYLGLWTADTLAVGQRLSADARYTGHFAARRDSLGRIDGLHPEGQGRLESAALYYNGTWHEGRRHGEGFGCEPKAGVRYGTWRHDKFKGEHMVYTSQRVYGIDISRYQHEIPQTVTVRGRRGRKRKVKRTKVYPIDWNNLRISSLGPGRRSDGTVDYPVSFVYIKATEGTAIVNKYYTADQRAARSRGIAVGAYHFLSYKSTGEAQAAWFLRHASVQPRDLPPVLDVEPTDRQIADMGGRDVLFSKMQGWLRVVEQRTGKRPILYVSQNFIDKHLVHAPERLKSDYEVWVARYGAYRPYVRLLHWQLSPQGKVRGIHGDVDINVFNGTKAQFADYLRSL